MDELKGWDWSSCMCIYENWKKNGCKNSHFQIFIEICRKISQLQFLFFHINVYICLNTTKVSASNRLPTCWKWVLNMAHFPKLQLLRFHMSGNTCRRVAIFTTLYSITHRFNKKYFIYTNSNKCNKSGFSKTLKITFLYDFLNFFQYLENHNIMITLSNGNLTFDPSRLV